MQIRRRFTSAGTDPFGMVSYEEYHCAIKHQGTGKVILDMPGCLVPAKWSKNARDTVISKYFRKAGVPSAVYPSPISFDGPEWLRPRTPAGDAWPGAEKSIKDVARRIVGHWTYAGWINGYFDPSDRDVKESKRKYKAGVDVAYKLREINALAYYDEMVYMLLNQMGAPNSPQWFNTGLWWAYGIEGEPQGHYYVDDPANTQGGFNAEIPADAVPLAVKRSPNAFQRVQAHACFILNVEDTMMGPEGIVDWYNREARIFKYGSGSGVNISNLRAKGEPLSGGGQSSGMLSWMEVADRSAGAIKSGGTTRRAAKMVCLDLDHPDIVDFVNCKIESEMAVACMVIGSDAINHFCKAITRSVEVPDPGLVDEARKAGVPENYILKALALWNQREVWPDIKFDTDFDHRAYQIAPFQNSNNSVRIASAFYKAVDTGSLVELHPRTNTINSMLSCVEARKLEHQIAFAAWFSGDPGVQYDTIINDWNVTPNDGRIDASNPCSEHMRPNNSACNLASIRLMQFFGNGRFDGEAFMHAVRLWVITLDITNSMAHLPDAATARNVYLYRDIGLGFADLGAVIMAMGLPYDSDQGRAVAGFVAALMQGQAYLTSAELAENLGQYPRFKQNQEAHFRCVRNHMAAAGVSFTEFEGLTVPPQKLAHKHLLETTVSEDDLSVLDAVWEMALESGGKHGYRNAELTVIAPTGTTGIVMDCDTTGIEPLFALQSFKQLVGGGTFTMAPTRCVELAMDSMGFLPDSKALVIKHVQETGTIPNPHDTATGVIHETQVPVFATALSNDPNNPPISWQAHIKMMGAVQSFISGGISKTVNMSADASIGEIKSAFRMGHDLGCKAIAVYRDTSKLSQPLTLKKKDEPATIPQLTVVPRPAMVVDVTPLPAQTKAIETAAKLVSPPDLKARVRLGWNRSAGIDIAVQLGLGNVYLRTTRYDDGKCAEIWVTYSADQGMVQALLSTLCKTANVALQYGVPLRAILDSWLDANFEPSGLVGVHPYIKTCKSVVNLVARLLMYHELGDTTTLNVQPTAHLSDTDEQAVNDAMKESPASFQGVKLTGEKCPECGSQQYVSSGSGCKKCLSCGHSGGCG